MRLLPVGADALLLDLVDRGDADPAAWFAQLLRLRQAGELVSTEIVPGARTVLLDGLADPAATAAALSGWAPTARTSPAGGPLVEIPVRYDGADLAEVARRWGVPERGVAERLGATELRVAFCGFAPGFAYLTGLPPELAVPRLATPRPRVPAGSVALADAYVGIYPSASPGGWLLVGHTDEVLFDADRSPPALLAPGDRVRLVAPVPPDPPVPPGRAA